MTKFIGKSSSKVTATQHLHTYQLYVTSISGDTRVLYKIFPESLDGSVLIWFDSLKPGSIRSYDDLVRQFLKRY